MTVEKKSKIWKWTFSRQPHFIPKLFLWPSNVMVATEKWLLWSFQWWVPRAGNDFGFGSVKHSAHQSDCLSSNILFLEWRFTFAWTDLSQKYLHTWIWTLDLHSRTFIAPTIMTSKYYMMKLNNTFMSNKWYWAEIATFEKCNWKTALT